MPSWLRKVKSRVRSFSVAAAALPLAHVTEIAARTRAAHTGRTVGMAEVAAVRDMVTAFSAMDERHGGAHGRTALVQYLRDDIATLCRARHRTEEVRAQMLSAAGRAGLDLTRVQWTVSSHSGGGGHCIRIGALDGHILIGDTKNPDRTPHIFTPTELRAFLLGVRDGEFDHLVQPS
ncbi:DUF397 domain-containing protein (plasmid) [Streptomyces clavuligerus]|uniref:Putative regulator n=1 Tax=Streptomyces clavuligerus TaxID=1901 RepID=B5GZJ5_STRCL|nr:hypothetical protein SSCG_04812 [Streptomyces clavuligerus]EFG03903.1 Putative regulator [Streptomyces clavuligerus]MBY6307591.1 DUF397 domain-containing protein [Streptomyces clavuligerus]QCS10902.1 DUF397 domain-containing protein [Streptomyces clavuligerus]QPJ98098.1 DUF397 domain-containing protein [Streptomyces clavuligerus]